LERDLTCGFCTRVPLARPLPVFVCFARTEAPVAFAEPVVAREGLRLVTTAP
jgi:hypothetical protein